MLLLIIINSQIITWCEDKKIVNESDVADFVKESYFDDKLKKN